MPKGHAPLRMPALQRSGSTATTSRFRFMPRACTQDLPAVFAFAQWLSCRTQTAFTARHISAAQ
eukprot:CAMPEP_0205912908 /NCGR_PEP_ID=MMETSP1325-20131115/6163_1 /ASSEMBLY_ACC=CAM_ASM_000708 /TAXON_ID=236786 /ORGANISM="Florenciella sp., Strain RCC1007" /LENGTH=63 /DNA_ID=CAMNT_0053279685 /DNA_START=112 /DNA_END=306 /DNA_ORIENTATION=+